MIRRDELKPGVEYRIPNGASLTDGYIMQRIANKAAKYGIAVGFRQDFLCDNALTGWLKLDTTDCIVIYDARSSVKSPRPDFIIVTKRVGTYLFITINEYQHSWSGSNWCDIMGDVFREMFA